jgi:hypothetical protein
MTRVIDALARLWMRITGRRHDVRLTEEIEAHIAMLVDEHVRAGLSPSEARAAAMRDGWPGSNRSGATCSTAHARFAAPPRSR